MTGTALSSGKIRKFADLISDEVKQRIHDSIFPGIGHNAGYALVYFVMIVVFCFVAVGIWKTADDIKDAVKNIGWGWYLIKLALLGPFKVNKSFMLQLFAKLKNQKHKERSNEGGNRPIEVDAIELEGFNIPTMQGEPSSLSTLHQNGQSEYAQQLADLQQRQEEEAQALNNPNLHFRITAE